MQPLARTTLALTRSGASFLQRRGHRFLSGPPNQRISMAEKAIHGVAITVGLLVVPSWVLVHIKDYQGGE